MHKAYERALISCDPVSSVTRVVMLDQASAVREAKAAVARIAKRDASDLDRALMVLPNLPLCIGWMGNWIRVLGRRKVGEEAGCCVCDLARGS